MPLHAQRQGFQAAQHKKTVERASDCADRILQKRDFIGEFFTFADQKNAAHQIGMPNEIFSGGIDDDIVASFVSALNPKRHNGVSVSRNDFTMWWNFCD